MINRHIARGALTAATAAVLALGLAACNDDTTGSSSATGAPTTASTQAPAKKTPQAPAKSAAQEFKDYVTANGTANEKAAAKHVLKIQGGDANNDILDTAEIHTDLTGSLMDSATTGAAKLLASSFRDFEQARGKASKNGLVTVYNASGDVVGTGQY